jgi:hypothetical protein
MARINETTARTAWNGIHMSSYEAGSATREWDGMCHEARIAADEAIKRAPERTDEIEAIYERYESRAADYINERNSIDAMCPSVLIVGGANFPTSKKNKQVARLDAFYKKDFGFDKLLNKLRLIGTDREAIKSGDDDAIAKLERKLEVRQKRQEEMKAANAWYRKHKTLDGLQPESVREAAQNELDFQLKTLYFRDDADREAYKLKTKPYTYKLTNNNSEINRIKKRIEALKAAKEAAESEPKTGSVCGEPCEVIEDANDMRIRLVFDGKPSDECRALLKRNGFRWSPRNAAWQRQLNENGRFAVRRVLDAA